MFFFVCASVCLVRSEAGMSERQRRREGEEEVHELWKLLENRPACPALMAWQAVLVGKEIGGYKSGQNV